MKSESSTDMLKNYIVSLDTKYKIDTICSEDIFQGLYLKEEVLLVYKEVPTLAHEKKAIAGILLKDGDVDGYLEGSPLAAPFNASDLTLGDTIGNLMELDAQSVDYLKYGPVTLQHARTIISQLNTSPSFDNITIPIYIVTDGKDHMKTILLGGHRIDGWVSTMIVNISDGFDGQSQQFVNGVLEEHCKMSRAPLLLTESTVKSVFQIYGSTQSSTLELHLKWDTPSMEVPISEAKTDIILSCKMGCPECIITPLWQQIQLLVKYISLVKHWRTNAQTILPYERFNTVLPTIEKIKSEIKSESSGEVSNPSETLQKKVIEIIQNDKKNYNTSEVWRKKNNTSEVTVFDKTLFDICEQILTNDITSRDLSDKLYNVLIECTMYKDLDVCIQIIFQQLRANVTKGSKMNISTKRASRFASATRSIIQGDKINPEQFLDPLELLVELGLEKLKEDYSYVFLKANLVNEDQLDLPVDIPQFNEMTSEDWLVYTVKYINYLVNLHVRLSVLLKTNDCMRVSQSALNNIATSTFSIVDITYDEIINNDGVYNFNCPVSTASIKEFITGSKLFNSWNLQLRNQSKKRHSSSSSLLTMKPLPIDPATATQHKPDMDVTLSKLSPFHHYVMKLNSINFNSS